MEKDELIKIANYIILNMESPHDSLQMKIICYFKEYKNRNCTNEEFVSIKNFLIKEEMLIEKLPKTQSQIGALYKLTNKGKEVVSLGGIQNYYKKIKKNNIKSVTYNLGKDYLLPVIAICVSIIAIIKSYKEDLKTEINQKNLENLHFEIETIEERLKQLDEEYIKHIDSLYKQINKLKEI